MVIDAEEPIVSAERDGEREKRQRDECKSPHVDGERRIAVAVLPNREPPEEQRRRDEENEIENRADDEEVPIQVGAFAIENRVEARLDIHPLVKVMAVDDDRDEENDHYREEHREILKLPPNDYRPFGIDDVMNDDPEEAAGQGREIKGEREQPRETELLRRNEGAHYAQAESNDSDDREQ